MAAASPVEHDVLFLLGAYQLRGSVARGLVLATKLAARDVRLRLISTENVRFPTQPCSNLSVRVSRHLNWPLITGLSRRSLRTDLRRDPPELIDIQHRSLHEVGAWLARKLKRPYIVTIYDYLREREQFMIDPQWCRQVIAISDSVKAELLQRTRIPAELVSVIPTGIEPPPEHQCPSILRDGRNPVIGTTGALESGKGLDLFLRAAVEIRKQLPGAMFLIAGSGPEERSLRVMARDLGLTESLTILPNLLHFGPALQAIDLFVLPALKQGLASTMLEAMAYRLPVIGTESGGVRSVITHDVTGILVPPADVNALADQVITLVRNPDRARELGAAARRCILERYDVQNMVQATLDIYGRVTAT